jgi:DNA-binding NtrC family response regulator
MLQTAGYIVAVAENITRAKQLAAAQQFDVVISDVGLPDGSGLDLMRHLRETYGLAGVALSGFGTDDDVNASKTAGFAEHLTKPVDWERLKSVIERLMNERPEGARAAAS